MMKSFTVVFDPNASPDLIMVHATGCKDLGKARVLYARGIYSHIGEVLGESGKDVLEAELNEDFSGKGEHPATESYPEGSYGAAGFTGRVLPCCKNAKEV